MNSDKQKNQTEQFEMVWQRLFIQGAIILLLGGILALASIFNGHAIILNADELSWLPASGMLLLALGLLECIEAKFTKNSREFQQNIQVGVLDTVIGALTFLSVAEELVRFSMMLAAFLIARGGVRIVMVFSLNLPNRISTALSGVVSISLGWMVWQQWPTAEGWFLSLCVNIEILFRGWAMMMFSFWVREKKKRPSGF